MKKLLLFILISFPLFSDSPFHTDIVITSPYLATTGFGGERRNNVHKGLDCYAVNYYPVIHPVASGEVVEIGMNRIYGKYVIVSHEDERGVYYSLYAHGKLIYYSAKGKVSVDTPLMIMGSTGYSDNPHLHLEIYRIVDGAKINEDPINYITSVEDN
jgi:murein DD-endopeptidase MepM/ murein hydrolase activator NlpD